jgi:hypothetical protein
MAYLRILADGAARHGLKRRPLARVAPLHDEVPHDCGIGDSDPAGLPTRQRAALDFDRTCSVTHAVRATAAMFSMGAKATV